MRKLAYLLLVALFITGALVVYSAVSLWRTAGDVTQPIGDLVRDLVVEATPVILPDPVAIVQEINELARLETASMSIQQVVTAERNQEPLWGALGESLIFVAYGDVIAGVDLMKMSPDDIQVVDPVTVIVHLPEVEVFVATLDNERSYVADRDEGFLASADPFMETQVRQAAEQQILAAALEADILGKADLNAETYMDTFLRSLGFETIIFSDTTPPPAPPFEQVVPKGFALTPVAP